MLIRVVQLRRPLLLIAIGFLCTVSNAQSPTLGDGRAETKEALQVVSRYFSDYVKMTLGRDSAATVVELGDTLIYRVSGDEEVKYEYVFSKDLCVAIRVRFSCLACMHLTYRKWFFKGRWRMDENRTMFRIKDPARATIKRAVDCPFLYQADLVRMESPVSKEDLKKMKKVKKKLIGTWESLLIER